MNECLQSLINASVFLSEAKRQRIGQFCSCVILAESSQLSQLAMWLAREGKQEYREQWLRQLLDATYVSQSGVSEAWFKEAIQGYQAKQCHLIMDRVNLIEKQVDLLTLALAYRHRAIPIK